MRKETCCESLKGFEPDRRDQLDGKQVLVCNGPFGTYVRSGTRNKKLVSESAAFSITLQEAAKMFQYKVAAKQRKSKSN